MKRTLPDLRLAFSDGGLRETVHIHSPEFPSIDEITRELTQVRRNFPKLPYIKTDSSGDGHPMHVTSGQAALSPLLQRKNERIRRYNASLDTYYGLLEKYLHDVTEHDNLFRRATTLDLNLINDTPLTLKSLYITIRFPAHVRVFAEDHLPEPPVSPPAPELPDLDALFDTIRLPAVPVPNELRQEPGIVLRSRNLSPLEIRWNKGWDVIYSLREVDRNHSVAFNPLYLVFNSFDSASSLRVPYRITMASISQEERGHLELLVRKVIQ